MSSGCVNVIHTLNSGCGISVGVSIVAAISLGVRAFLACTHLMIFIALLGLGVCPVGVLMLFIASRVGVVSLWACQSLRQSL